jgi:phospholipid/cholesterol/gamma-HCH transport system substrate-binding protein
LLARRRRIEEAEPLAMNTAAPTPGRIVVISGFALTCFGLLLFLWLAFGGAIPLKPKGYRVQVAFTDAASLADQADVRTAGVSIGKVVRKQLAPGGNRTLATLELKSAYAPLKADARAILRQKTLLGETYVELTTGSRDAPDIKEGGRLRDGRVRQAVEFDEFLQVFDKPTRKAFQEWQASVAQAGTGRGRDLSDALGNLPSFTENARSVVDVLDDRRAVLRDLVHNAGRTFEQISRDENALSTLVRRNTELFGELSDRRDALASSIRIFPTFLDESKQTLARLRTFSVDTEPLIRDLEPVLSDLQPTTAALRRLSPDLENLFDNVDPLITAGDRGLPALSRVLRAADPTLASAGPFLQQLNPVLQFLELNQAKVTDFLDIGPAGLAGIRSTVPGSKSNGHVLPQVIMTGGQSLPALRRSKDNRGNAYLSPASTRDPSTLTLPSFDCKHVGEKGPTNTPGCKVAGPLPVQGRSQFFPQVHEAGPGGVPAGG